MTDKQLLKKILEAIYIEDCHITGMHDPNHTSKYICADQLADMARRVLAVSHGVKFATGNVSTPVEELNKIPRKLTSSWYDYYKNNSQYQEKATALKNWATRGFDEAE